MVKKCCKTVDSTTECQLNNQKFLNQLVKFLSQFPIKVYFCAQLFNYSVTQLFNYSIIQLFNYSIIQLFNKYERTKFTSIFFRFFRFKTTYNSTERANGYKKRPNAYVYQRRHEPV